jgi:hypothetical protein
VTWYDIGVLIIAGIKKDELILGSCACGLIANINVEAIE